MEKVISFVGILAFLGGAWLFSTNRKKIPYRIIAWGLGLQFFFAWFVMVFPPGRRLFLWLNGLAVSLLEFSTEGAKFVFGGLATSAFLTKASASPGSDFVFAFQVLTTIIFFSSLMSVLYYLRVMQVIVWIFAKLMSKTMRTSGAESLAASANIFFGQTEAPLVVKPYIEKMTRSELMAVMTGGFATVAGGVMAAYIGMLRDSFPNIAGHLISASVLSAPAALVLAKILIPEEETPVTQDDVKFDVEVKEVNVVDAAATGASMGLTLALNVGAMLVAFVALVALVNAMIGYFGGWFGFEDLTLQTILGFFHYPVAILMGVAAEDAMIIGTLMGEKLVLTEFLAYLHLGDILRDGSTTLQPRSVVIATYALCGFANFASIAIQIGGIRGIAPSRSADLAKLGLKAMIAGAFAAYLTGCVAGIFYSGETILLG